MKNIITSSGFLGAVKWNGKWFSDQEKEFSRLILPMSTDTSSFDQCNSLKWTNVSFHKSHQENDVIFNGKSNAYELLDRSSMKIPNEIQDRKVLWAYRKGKISFLNYGTLREVTNFTLPE
ncbi:hypothetical protein [Leptospira meyeri]|nr:hypothetical protein [Leptospira meyeri]